MKEKTELAVKYQNKLNLVPLKNFNSKEMDLFFALCARMKDRGTEEISFTFEELRNLSDYKMTATKAVIKDLDSMYSKMLQLTYRENLFDDDDDGFRRFVLFTGFEVSTKQQVVKVSVNSKLESVINGLTTEFSKFELAAFTSIRSSYAKTLFRLLMQYRSTGYYQVNIEEFKEIMDVPK
ncbi:replication initiation protein, partial [Enterococcus faecalis]|uniref:replication initiation protein n=1 Tax=Enterococcus faecalis TaxID=1351 RepID=UPI00317E7717